MSQIEKYEKYADVFSSLNLSPHHAKRGDLSWLEEQPDRRPGHERVGGTRVLPGGRCLAGGGELPAPAAARTCPERSVTTVAMKKALKRGMWQRSPA